MSLHVVVKLADGRVACADYRQPIVTVMRRCLARIEDDRGNHKGKGPGCPADRADKAMIADALDYMPELFCDMANVVSGTCPGHGPADSEPFTPPPYKRPVTGGLW